MNSQQVDGGEIQTITTRTGIIYRYFPHGSKAYITFNSMTEFFIWQDHTKEDHEARAAQANH